MITPPLHVIQNTTYKDSGRLYFAANPSIQQGYYSDFEQLTFKFEVTKYEGSELHLQIYFDNPLYVSSNFESVDFLQI